MKEPNDKHYEFIKVINEWKENKGETSVVVDEYMV